MATHLERPVTAMRRTATHPFTPAAVLLLAAAGVAGSLAQGQQPRVVSWVVLALCAGYAVSGSV
jgi:hypothetical protein